MFLLLGLSLFCHRPLLGLFWGGDGDDGCSSEVLETALATKAVTMKHPPVKRVQSPMTRVQSPMTRVGRTVSVKMQNYFIFFIFMIIILCVFVFCW